MTARLLDGKGLAQQLQAELRDEVTAFIERTGIMPGLDVVLVGENPASEVYVRNKHTATEKAGMRGSLHRLPVTTSSEELLAVVDRLNRDPAVHGILVQLPLPAQIPSDAILAAIDPRKDVDAFHAENVGLLVQGRPRFLPCTPHGVVQILQRCGIPTAGKHAVIVGRSDIVGKPLANMLVQKGLDCTVTVCHSRTVDLPSITRQADILIAAIGVPRFIKGDMVKPGAVVIDVGINRVDDPSGKSKLCGDVDFDAVKEVASAITPVPGGVGPLTITMLLKNTLLAAKHWYGSGQR
jgi:methylenetetrahydrofolate dehydrogenase (NADP+)/methenyltetrahydrofolate cyclohydrolase